MYLHQLHAKVVELVALHVVISVVHRTKNVLWYEFLLIVGEAGIRSNQSMLIKGKKILSNIIIKEKHFYQKLRLVVENNWREVEL